MSRHQTSRRAPRHWAAALRESASLAVDSVRTQPARSVLAIVGVVIGIVTVVLVASVLANLRNQVALLFRELGTENIFAFHLTGDPYATPSEAEARRLPLKPSFAVDITRDGRAVREVAVQVIVPTIVGGRALTARVGDRESDTVLVEGASSNFFEVVGAEFAAGRPFTDLEDRAGAQVAVIGSSLARALYGARGAVGRSLTLGGDTYFVVGEIAPRKGGFFGENRQDSVLAIPVGTVRRRYPDAERTVLYVRAKPGMREDARRETEATLRRLRRLRPEDSNDFTLSSADQIIRSLDSVSAQVGLVTVLLAAVSLFIGGIGIANVQIISAKERTREIGVRLAIGAPRRDVLNQFLLEAALLSTAGGLAGVLIALLVGLLLGLVFSGFSAIPPLWAVVAGLVASLTVGIVAGYWPARQAAAMDPVEALRYE
jgi:putative ABC transport system permease protein